jgi:hypothetical protein
VRLRGVLGAITLIAGCDEPAGAPPPVPPAIDAAAVAASPHNALSAVVSARVRDAYDVEVRFREGDAPAVADSVTPIVPVTAEEVTIPVFGLRPGRRYVLRVVAHGVGGTLVGDPLELTTDTLPSDLPHYTAGGSDPSPGYVVFAAGMYGLVIDNTGRVVWYYRFPSGPGLNFQALSTGRYAARPPEPPGRWVELDPLGNVTRTFGCAGGLVPRFHDLIAEGDGSYWIMCDETRIMDLSGLGGLADARVTGTVVQHVSGTGTLLFQWNPFDHFAITDLPLADRTGSNVNWTHGNALDLDTDGNVVVSFRSLDEITKIDTRTGALVWRMGGLGNQFTFEGTPMPAFARQHGLRLTGPGRFVLLDNSGDPAASRAERYTFDPGARSARLVASYGSLPAVTAQLGGTTQDLPAGRTLVAFGNGGRVEEYDASGGVVWRIEGNPGYIFRAQRITSLYQPGVGSPR